MQGITTCVHGPVVVTTMNIAGKVMEATGHSNCFKGAAEWNKMY